MGRRGGSCTDDVKKKAVAVLLAVLLVPVGSALTISDRNDPTIRYGDGTNITFGTIEADNIIITNDTLSVDDANVSISGAAVNITLERWDLFTPRINYNASAGDGSGDVTFTHTALPAVPLGFFVDGTGEAFSEDGSIEATVGEWSTKDIEIKTAIEPGPIQKIINFIVEALRDIIDLSFLNTGEKIVLGLILVLAAGVAVGSWLGSGTMAAAAMVVTAFVLPFTPLWPDWIGVVFTLVAVLYGGYRSLNS